MQIRAVAIQQGCTETLTGLITADDPEIRAAAIFALGSLIEVYISCEPVTSCCGSTGLPAGTQCTRMHMRTCRLHCKVITCDQVTAAVMHSGATRMRINCTPDRTSLTLIYI